MVMPFVPLLDPRCRHDSYVDAAPPPRRRQIRLEGIGAGISDDFSEQPSGPDGRDQTSINFRAEQC
jgi:hypothetical protein